MEFRILGPLEVFDGGDTVPLGGHRQRMVLAVLLLYANRVVSVDRLVDAVWGEVPPSTARKTLQTYVARLRKAIGEDQLTAAESGYILQVGPDDLDSFCFEELAREGHQLLTVDPPGAASTLRRSLAEWRGLPWGDLGDESALRPESERLKELRLVVQGDRIEADLACGADSDLIPELQGLVSRHPWREGFTAQLMVALYRSGRQAEALRVFAETRRSLGEELGIDPSPELRHLEEQILMQDPALHTSSPGQTEPTVPRRNPYKGLRAFAEADSGDFHGRSQLTDELVARIADSPFIAVVGPSGSGKSSAVKAGVLPKVRHLGVSGLGDRLIATMVPGAHPFEELEAALLRASPESIAGLADQMRGDDLDVLRCVLRVRSSDEAHLVLIIDQFEELFVLTIDSGVRNRFIRNIVQAVEDPHSQLTIVATLRADFFDRVLSEPQIGPLVDQGLVNVLPLTASELEAAALEPARDTGVEMEPELIAELVAATHDQPGALPLFQYVLTELFEERSGNLLTVDAYVRLGGLDGALARRADEVFESLDANQQGAARQVFLRLVSLGEDGATTKQRVLRGDLEPLGTDEVDVSTVLDSFDTARLLTFDRDPIEEQSTVEVAHEALFRGWDRLRTWIADAQVDLRVHRSLSVAVREWERSDRDPDYLVTGSKLDVFESWRREATLRPTSLEDEFIDLSLARKDSELLAEGDRSERELQTKRRSIRRLQWLVAVAAVAALVAATLTVLAVNRGREASASQRVARAGDLAYASSSYLNVDPELSILLALESIDTTEAVDGFVLTAAEEALHRAVDAHRVERIIPGFFDVAFVNDNLTVTTDDRVHLTNATTGEELWSIDAPDTVALSVAASADGALIAIGSASGRIVMWDAATGDEVREFTRSGRTAHKKYVRDIVFSPDGTLLASASGGELAIRIWDVETGDLITEIEEPEAAGWRDLPDVPQLAFHPDGTKLAVTGFFDAAANVLDVQSGLWAEPFPGEHTPTFGIRYFPDGNRLVTSDVDGVINVWDVATRSILFPIFTDVPGIRLPYLDVSRDGRRLAASGDDEAIRVWDLSATGARLSLTLAGQHGIPQAVAFSPDGATVASAAEDIRIWDATPQGRGEIFAAASGGTALAFDPSGTLLGLATNHGDVALVDTGTWETTAVLDHPETVDGAAAIAGIDWSPDAEFLATSMTGGAVLLGPGLIQVWNPLAAKAVRTLSDAYPRLDVAYGPDQVVAASICQRPAPQSKSWESPARAWDAVSGEELFVARVPTCGHAVDLDPQGRFLAVQTELDVLTDAEMGGNVQIWDLKSARLTLTVEHQPGFLGSVRFSPDGQRFLTGGVDGVIIWDSETGDEQVHLVGSIGNITRAVWTPDGKRIVAGDSTGAIRIWDADSGEPLLGLLGHVGAVVGLAVNPDGRWVASSEGGGPTIVWTLDLDELVEIARGRLTRTFTPDECIAYAIEGCDTPEDDEDTSLDEDD